ncbi:MAG: hypothetical protein ABL958_02670 [Bdellovibrionia bacterium]
MKKFTAIALVCLFAVNAHATKARVASLLGARHLTDSQTIFTSANHVNDLGQYMTLELGPTADGATEPKAEGGLFRKMDDAVMGIYLGHHDAFQAAARSTAFQLQTNPIHVFYGKSNWGAHVGLSNTDKKTTKVSEQTFYGGFGMDHGDMEWSANLELIGAAKKEVATVETKYTGVPEADFHIQNEMGSNFIYGDIGYGQTKSETGGTSTNTKDTALMVGWLDRSYKTNGRDLYYGIGLAYADRDTEGKHRTTMALPVSLGLEYTVTDWATFRGSIQQNFLLGSTKDEIPPSTTTDSDSIANNTTVAAGLGLKHKDLSVDGTLAAATSGDVNGTAFLARAGLIYNF